MATTSIMKEFEDVMKSIKTLSPEAHAWLAKRDPRQ